MAMLNLSNHLTCGALLRCKSIPEIATVVCSAGINNCTKFVPGPDCQNHPFQFGVASGHEGHVVMVVGPVDGH